MPVSRSSPWARTGPARPCGGVRWVLSRVETNFQWYQRDGQWDYEPVTRTQRVADGSLDLAANDAARIEAKVDWGGYKLELSTADGRTLPASLSFEAGWYVAPGAADTPDLLKVSLDKASYLVGETARVRIEPRFPGTALVMVLDDRLIAMSQVEVPAEGVTAELPVTEAWGPGAYVTAVLFRPMDLAAKRMPARALGLTWAAVDPGAAAPDTGADGDRTGQPQGALGLASRPAVARRGRLCRRRHRGPGHPQPDPLPAAGPGRLVLRPAPARHGPARPLRPAHRPHAGGPRRGPLRR